MIYIKNEDYCQKCPEFIADQETTVLYNGNDIEIVNHVIKCKHAERCKAIKKYLTGVKK